MSLEGIEAFEISSAKFVSARIDKIWDPSPAIFAKSVCPLQRMAKSGHRQSLPLPHVMVYEWSQSKGQDGWDWRLSCNSRQITTLPLYIQLLQHCIFCKYKKNYPPMYTTKNLANITFMVHLIIEY